MSNNINTTVNTQFTGDASSVLSALKSMEKAFTELRKTTEGFFKSFQSTDKSFKGASDSLDKHEKAISGVSNEWRKFSKYLAKDFHQGLKAPLQAFIDLSKGAKQGGAALDWAGNRAIMIGKSLAGLRDILNLNQKQMMEWGRSLDWATIKQAEFDQQIRFTGASIDFLEKEGYSALKLNDDQIASIEHLSKSQSKYAELLRTTAQTYPHLTKSIEDLGKVYGTHDAAVISWKKNLMDAERGITRFVNGIIKTDKPFADWMSNLDRAKVVQAHLAGQLDITTKGIKINNEAGLKAIGIEERMAASKGLLSKQYNIYGRELQNLFQTNKGLVPIYEKLTAQYGRNAETVKAVSAELGKFSQHNEKFASTQQRLSDQLKNGEITLRQYNDRLANSATLLSAQPLVYQRLANAVQDNLQKHTVYGNLLEKNAHRGHQFTNALRDAANVYGANSTALQQYGANLAKVHDTMVRTIMSSDKTAEAKAKLVQNFNAATVAASVLNNKLVEQNGVYVRAIPAMNAVQQAFYGIGQAMKTMAAYMPAALLLGGLMRVVSSMVREVVQFDQAMKDLQAIINATDHDISRLSSTVKDVAADTKYSMTEVADGMKILGQAGLDATEIVQAITHTSHLATGTLSSFKDAADLVTTAVRAFGLEFSDTQRVVDVFANAINRSKLTVEKIRVAFNYVAPVARAAGVSFEETSAALMALANAGIRASTMGTALRQILMHLQQPNMAFRSAVQAAGMTVDDVNPRIVGFAEAIENVAKVAPTAVEALQFFKLRAAPAVAILTAQGSAGLRRLEEALEEAGAAARMFETQTEGLGIKWKQVADKFSVFAVNVGESGFGGVLRATADLLRGLLDILNFLIDTSIGKAITGFGMMTGALLLLQKATAGLNIQSKLLIATNAATVISFNASTVATGKYTVAINLLATAKTRLIALSRLLWTTLKKNPIIAVTGIIIGLTQAFSHLSKSGERTVRNFEDLADKARTSGQGIQEYANQIADAEAKGRNWSHISERLIRDFPELESAVRKAGSEFSELSKVLDTAILKNYEEALKNTSEAILEAGKNLSFFGKVKKELLTLPNPMDALFPQRFFSRLDEHIKEEEKWLKAKELNYLRAAKAISHFGVDVRSTVDEIETVLLASGVQKNARELAENIYRIYQEMEDKIDKRRRIPSYFQEFFDNLDLSGQQKFYEAFRDFNLELSKGLEGLGDDFESSADRIGAVQELIAENAEKLAERLEKFGMDYETVLDRLTRPQSLNLFDNIIREFNRGNEELDEEAQATINVLNELNADIYQALSDSASSDPFRFIDLVEGLSSLSEKVNETKEQFISMGKELDDPIVKIALVTKVIEELQEVLGTSEDAARKAEIAFYELTGQTEALARIRFEVAVEEFEKLAIAAGWTSERIAEAKIQAEAFFRTSKGGKDYESVIASINSEWYKMTGTIREISNYEWSEEVKKWTKAFNEASAAGKNLGISLKEFLSKKELLFEEETLEEIQKAIDNISLRFYELTGNMEGVRKIRLNQQLEEIYNLEQALKKAGIAAEDLGIDIDQMRELIRLESETEVAEELADAYRALNKEWLGLTHQGREFEQIAVEEKLKGIVDILNKTDLSFDEREDRLAEFREELEKIADKNIANNIRDLANEVLSLQGNFHQLHINETAKNIEDFEERILKLIGDDEEGLKALARYLGVAEISLESFKQMFGQGTEESDFLKFITRYNAALDESARKMDELEGQRALYYAQRTGDEKKIAQAELALHNMRKDWAEKELQFKIDNAESWSDYFSNRLAQDLGLLDSALERKRKSWEAYYDAVKSFASDVWDNAKSTAADAVYWAIWEGNQKAQAIEDNYEQQRNAIELSRRDQIYNAQQTISDHEKLNERLAEIDRKYYDDIQELDRAYYADKQEHMDKYRQMWNSFLDDLVKSYAKMVVEILAEQAKLAVLNMFNRAISSSSPAAAAVGSASTVAFSGVRHHEGGIVGRDGTPISIPATAALSSLPRFHNGLQPDEIPAVLQHGERVVSKQGVMEERDALRDISNKLDDRNSSGQNVRIVNVLDPELFDDWASSSSGETVMKNFIRRNSAYIKQVVK